MITPPPNTANTSAMVDSAASISKCSQELTQAFVDNIKSLIRESINYLNSNAAKKAKKEDLVKFFQRNVINLNTSCNNLQKSIRLSNSLGEFVARVDDTLSNLKSKLSAATPSSSHASAASVAPTFAEATKKTKIKIGGNKSVSATKIHKIEITPIDESKFASLSDVKISILKGVDPAKIGFIPSKIYHTPNKGVVIDSRNPNIVKLLDQPQLASLNLKASTPSKARPRLSLFNEVFTSRIAVLVDNGLTFLASSACRKGRKDDAIDNIFKTFKEIKADMINLSKAQKAVANTRLLVKSISSTLNSITIKESVSAPTSIAASTSATYANAATKGKVKAVGSKTVSTKPIHKVEISPINPDDFANAELVKCRVLDEVNPADMGFVPSKLVSSKFSFELANSLLRSEEGTFFVAQRFRDFVGNDQTMSGFGKSRRPSAPPNIQGAKTRTPQASTTKPRPLPNRILGFPPTTIRGARAKQRGEQARDNPANGPHSIPGSQPSLNCTKCGLGFPTAALLRQDVLKHQCGDRNKCPYCGLILSSYKSARAHERKLHPVESAASIEILRPMPDAEVLQTLAGIEAKTSARGLLKGMSVATGLTVDQVEHRMRRPDYERYLEVAKRRISRRQSHRVCPPTDHLSASYVAPAADETAPQLFSTTEVESSRKRRRAVSPAASLHIPKRKRSVTDTSDTGDSGDDVPQHRTTPTIWLSPIAGPSWENSQDTAPRRMPIELDDRSNFPSGSAHAGLPNLLPQDISVLREDQLLSEFAEYLRDVRPGHKKLFFKQNGEWMGLLVKVNSSKVYESSVASDSHLFMTSLVPLTITAAGTDIWKNTRPSSTNYCRALHFQYKKETPELIRLEKNRVYTEISELSDTLYVQFQSKIVLKSSKPITKMVVA
ncbi:unnamed protein product [Brassicogethes aeneus]|uniref:C2H2-type domain-containing protein n=1 Tax=Brassicogethes aeneus TaxID=1431903 RepID=A0A9P0FMC0_BRAAE|nr:unnamed protein product [Brassicogethes aeneus]